MSEPVPGETPEPAGDQTLRERLGLERDRWWESLSEAERQQLQDHQEAARRKVVDEQVRQEALGREDREREAQAHARATDYLTRAVAALEGAGAPGAIEARVGPHGAQAADVAAERGWVVGVDGGRDVLVTATGRLVLLEPAGRNPFRKRPRTGTAVDAADRSALAKDARGLEAVVGRLGVQVEGPGPV